MAPLPDASPDMSPDTSPSPGSGAGTITSSSEQERAKQERAKELSKKKGVSLAESMMRFLGCKYLRRSELRSPRSWQPVGPARRIVSDGRASGQTVAAGRARRLQRCFSRELRNPSLHADLSPRC